RVARRRVGTGQRVHGLQGGVVADYVTGRGTPHGVAVPEFDPPRPAPVARDPLRAIVAGELTAFRQPPSLRVRVGGRADIVRSGPPSDRDALRPASGQAELPQGGARDQSEPGGK